MSDLNIRASLSSSVSGQNAVEIMWPIGVDVIHHVGLVIISHDLALWDEDNSLR